MEVTALVRTRTESDSQYHFMLEKDERVWLGDAWIWGIVGHRLGKIHVRVTPVAGGELCSSINRFDWFGYARRLLNMNYGA